MKEGDNGVRERGAYRELERRRSLSVSQESEYRSVVAEKIRSQAQRATSERVQLKSDQREDNTQTWTPEQHRRPLLLVFSCSCRCRRCRWLLMPVIGRAFFVAAASLLVAPLPPPAIRAPSSERRDIGISRRQLSG